jgi:hypothetical protein
VCIGLRECGGGGEEGEIGERGRIMEMWLKETDGSCVDGKCSARMCSKSVK